MESVAALELKNPELTAPLTYFAGTESEWKLFIEKAMRVVNLVGGPLRVESFEFEHSLERENIMKNVKGMVLLLQDCQNDLRSAQLYLGLRGTETAADELVNWLINWQADQGARAEVVAVETSKEDRLVVRGLEETPPVPKCSETMMPGTPEAMTQTQTPILSSFDNDLEQTAPAMPVSFSEGINDQVAIARRQREERLFKYFNGSKPDSAELQEEISLCNKFLQSLQNVDVDLDTYLGCCLVLAGAHFGQYFHSGKVSDFAEAFEYSVTSCFLIVHLHPELEPKFRAKWIRAYKILAEYLVYVTFPEHRNKPVSKVAVRKALELSDAIRHVQTAPDIRFPTATLQFWSNTRRALLSERFTRGQEAIDDFREMRSEWPSSGVSPADSDGPSPRNRDRLAWLLYDRYRQNNDSNDLEAAIKHWQVVASSNIDGMSTRALTMLGGIYTSTRDINILGALEERRIQALFYYNQVLNRHPIRSSTASSRLKVAEGLEALYKGHRNKDDLCLTLDVLESTSGVVDTTSELYPEMTLKLARMYFLSGKLDDSIRWYQKRAEVSGQKELEPSDKQRTWSIEHQRKIARSDANSPSDRLSAAHRWALLALRSALPECLEACEVVSSQLGSAIWLGNKLDDKYAELRSGGRASFGATAVAAVLRFETERPSLAVEYLEQNLAMTYRQVLQLRGGEEFHRLIKVKPELGKRLEVVSRDLQHLSQTVGSSDEWVGSDNYKRGLEYQQLLQEIHENPGFENFFRPSPYAKLAAASSGGPVIMISSDWVTKETCALILLNSKVEPISMTLPRASHDEVKKHSLGLAQLLHRYKVLQRGLDDSETSSDTRAGKPVKSRTDVRATGMGAILGWLWTTIVEPVFLQLSMSGYKSGRIWWCPAGEFTRLPLHAAAPLEAAYIPSYTYMLETLINARSRATFTPTTDAPQILTIGISEYLGHRHPPLPSVKDEIRTIREILYTKRPAAETLSTIENTRAQVDTVMAAIKSSQVVHLACHGVQDTHAPLESHLVLSDGNLSLRQILTTDLPNAQFAFLSACQTATGDPTLANESIHLTGGFTVAGFRSIIGTMWSIADEDAPRVSREVYNSILGDEGLEITKAAEGLWKAVRWMRERGIPPHRWVPFIHVGI